MAAPHDRERRDHLKSVALGRTAAPAEGSVAHALPAAVSPSATSEESLGPRLRTRLVELAGDADLIRECKPGTTLVECDELLVGREDASAITRVGCCLVKWIACGCPDGSFADWALAR